MINEYVWKTYLKADGKRIVDFFERNLENSFSEEYAHKKFVSYTEFIAQVRWLMKTCFQN